MRTPGSGRGFTLIELLIVIAIIGILSATVLVSLNTARTKARTVAVKTQVNELRKLMELEYLETGTYSNLTRSWVGSGATNPTCENRGYAGNYASQAVAVCQALVANSGSVENKLLTVVNQNTPEEYTNATHYSIMAILPNGRLFCAGSSGRITDNVPFTSASYTLPGCYSNP